MKNILLILLGFIGFAAPHVINAQSFTPAADTVWGNVGSTAEIHNNITNTTTSPLNLRWHVTNTNFPNDWLVGNTIGICDANICYSNTADTLLWRITTGTPGNTFLCSYPASMTSDYHMVLDLTAATSGGTHYLTTVITDPGLYSKTVTWVISRVPAGVPSVTNNNDIVMYPNPAHDELNVVYDGNADIKNIAVYNIIGKVMAYYKVTGGSANLNLEAVPSGIYFVRLINSKGNVVTTKKFTKQ